MAEEESTSCPAAADDEETLTIRVKTVNDKHFEFVVQKSTLISNLKMRIKEDELRLAIYSRIYKHIDQNPPGDFTLDPWWCKQKAPLHVHEGKGTNKAFHTSTTKPLGYNLLA